VAILAAQLVAEGRQPTVRSAILAAMAALGAPPAAAPGEGLVRQHLQPMLMRALGAEGYSQLHRHRGETIDEVATLLATAPGVEEVVLAGRAAKGQLDGDVTAHLRVYTRTPIGELARCLVDAGCEEPRFSTAETRLGRRDRMVLEVEGVTIHVVRCLPQERRSAGLDLFSGRRIAVQRWDVTQFRP
jgi:hypothetical protein